MTAWSDAALAATLLAVEPALGGASLRARSGPAQTAWVALYLKLAADRAPMRLPPGVGDERLFGGLDLAATLAAGRPVLTPGLLAGAAGRALVLPMAERAGAALAARLGGAMDAGATFTLIALDEGAEPDERAPAALTDRLAFHPALEGVTLEEIAEGGPTAQAVAEARARLEAVRVAPDVVASLASVGMALGIGSLRAPILALAAARAAAALVGSADVDEAAATAAARLVLGPRARRLPEDAAQDLAQPDPPPEPDAPEEPQPENPQGDDERRTIPEELLLEAARAAIPPDVIARLLGAAAFRGPAGPSQGAGEDRKTRARGRPAGSTRGQPRDGARLDLIETLRAAAPWQPLRRSIVAAAGGDADRVLVRADDFRIKRARARAEKVVIFAVDASGSTALARLAEAKGAIELMLGQAYVARQQVALIAFRGTAAELLLPPTRSLVLTKRRLSSLPGGGGTPLASGLSEALGLARQLRGRGVQPYLALLTDGRANVGLDGAPGRPQAEADATRMAQLWRAEGLAATVIDTGARPTPAARTIADAMGATYLPLPRADARALSGALTAALAGAA